MKKKVFTSRFFFHIGRKITNSLVFKYDRSNQTFSLLQEIETNGAEGVSSLYDGVDYWIAFANGNDKTYSRIYRWSRALDRVRKMFNKV